MRSLEIRPRLHCMGTNRAYYASVEVKRSGECWIQLQAGYVSLTLLANSPEEMLRYLRELADAVEQEAREVREKGGSDA